MSDFDTTDVFDDDYLHFMRAELTDEISDAQVRTISRLLELREDMDVLDLACGHGRIANRIAALGCRVTGLDITPLFLEVAREAGTQVDYVQGDMRDLPWKEQFDRVVCWFTSYGYFDDEDNRRVLAETAKALRPGGKLLIDVINYVGILRVYQDTSSYRRGDDLLVDRRSLDPLAGRIPTERTVIRDGRVRRMRFTVRMFTFPELRNWLLQAGFTSVDGYGEDGKPLTADHRRMIVVAQR